MNSFYQNISKTTLHSFEAILNVSRAATAFKVHGVYELHKHLLFKNCSLFTWMGNFLTKGESRREKVRCLACSICTI